MVNGAKGCKGLRMGLEGAKLCSQAGSLIDDGNIRQPRGWGSLQVRLHFRGGEMHAAFGGAEKKGREGLKRHRDSR